MSCFLSQPVTSKLVRIRHGPGVVISAVSMQNRRKTMEDEYAIETVGQITVVAVFDGHGGDSVAKVCAASLPRFLAQLPVITVNSIKRAFVRFNDLFFGKDYTVGSTAVVSIITPDSFFVAHAGDSRAYLQIENDPVFRLVTNPHSPARPDEKSRIELTGAIVRHGRVLGELAVSRAFGDRRYAPAVMAEPEVVQYPRDGRPHTLVLMSDGLLERSDDYQVITQLHQESEQLAHLAAVNLCDWAWQHNNSADNCAVVFVQIDGQQSLCPIDRTFGIIEPVQMHDSSIYDKAYQHDLQRYALKWRPS